MIGMMIGRAAMRATTSGVSAATKNGTPPSEVKPTECAPVAVAAVVIGLAVIVIASMANGGQVVSWITPAAIIMGLVVLGGMFAAGASAVKVKTQKIRDIPGNPNAVPSAAELNAYYETLKPKPVTVEDMARTIAPTRDTARRYMSINMILAEEEAKVRRQRVNDILKAECPTCTAHEDDFCTFHPGQMVTRLEEGIIVHSTRVSYALKTRTAKLEDVKAQFNGRIPEDIIAGAL